MKVDETRRNNRIRLLDSLADVFVEPVSNLVISIVLKVALLLTDIMMLPLFIGNRQSFRTDETMMKPVDPERLCFLYVFDSL